MMYTVLLHLLISSAAIVQGRVALAEYGSPSFSSGAPTRSSSHWSRASSGRQLWRTVTESVVERIWHLPRRGFAAAECARHSVHADGQHQSKLYEHDLVLRFQIESAEEADALSRAVDTLLLDVWEFNDQWVDIRLSKTAVRPLLSLLPDSLQRAHRPLLGQSELMAAIMATFPSSPAADRPLLHLSGPSPPPTSSRHSRSRSTNLFFQNYQPLSVITPWMYLLQSLFPAHVQIISVGKTAEGRDMLAFKLGVHPTNRAAGQARRKTILITGGTHAREWISVSTVNYLAYTLITSYGRDERVTALLDAADWVLLPLANPDGYVYTWETDRLWRKNRQHTSLRFCPGIDLDRSWSYRWDGRPTRGNPCSESFAGDAPLAAVEAQQLASWVTNVTRAGHADFVGLLDLHSYSQRILYPYSYSCHDVPPALENLEELTIGMAKAIRLVRGYHYDVHPACLGNADPVGVDDPWRDGRRLFPRIESGAGSPLDWFYHELGVRYSIQIKLPDQGNYGFLLPSHEIVPTGEEIYKALLFFSKFLGVTGEKYALAPAHREDQSSHVEMDELTDPVNEDSTSSQIEWELKRRVK